MVKSQGPPPMNPGPEELGPAEDFSSWNEYTMA
jgi:hypothetical protein